MRKKREEKKRKGKFLLGRDEDAEDTACSEVGMRFSSFVFIPMRKTNDDNNDEKLQCRKRSGRRRETCVRDGWTLTVGLVRLVEDVVLKVLLVLHVGKDVRVVVLERRHRERKQREREELTTLLDSTLIFFFII